jgi:hypothetical protein
MDAIANLSFFKLHYDGEGVLQDPTDLARLTKHVAERRPARLVVVSHGWRNDPDDATALYQELVSNVSARLDALAVPASELPAVVGLYWPSMALPEEFRNSAAPAPSQDGGAAALRAPDTMPDRVKTRLDALIDALGGNDNLKRAKALVDTLEESPANQTDFVKLLQCAVPSPSDTSEDRSDRFMSGNPQNLFDRLKNPIGDQGPAKEDGAANLGGALSRGAANMLNAAQGALGSAFRLVNYLTFYVMKERAGTVGDGLNRTLSCIRRDHAGLPINLVGHSFGARLVTAAAARGVKLTPCSLSLLQAAYSHNSFAAKTEWEGGLDGYFRPIFSGGRVDGPIIATHTKNDQAVGLAYPIASRLAGQNANALGDANDPFGGVGRNGVLHVLAGERGPDGELLPADLHYAFVKGKTNNLLADKYIKDHSDVRNKEVANAVAQVITSL